MKPWSLIYAFNPARRGFPTDGHWSLDWKLHFEGGFDEVLFHIGRNLAPDLFELARPLGVQQLVVPLNALRAAVLLHIGFAFVTAGREDV